MSKEVILTGLRANNDLHIGNYLGALLPMIDMAKRHADDYQINLFVPDLHSFTTPIDHSKLYEQTMQNLQVFVAAGLPLDHDNIHIYRQSYIPAHSELTWILDCFTGFGEMKRMTQFKDKALTLTNRDATEYVSEDNKEDDFDTFRATKLYEKQNRVSVGLFNYPVLMAADILLYGATYVPVGDDQTQHLEFTRDIAERMNKQFGDLFVAPLPVQKQHEFFGKDQGLRIRDLVDPSKKMSKSDETGKGVIFLSDAPETARKKIMSAITDSYGEIKYDMKDRPGVSNLIQILSLLTQQELTDVAREYEGQTVYGPLKTATADAVAAFLTDFQTRLAQVDQTTLMQKLESSEATMAQAASQTLHKVQQAVGLRPNVS